MYCITLRQQSILEKLVDEYIKTAFPISSDFLKNEFFFNISPATIRIDLAELTESGFLEKPYVSGGRIPTDKGYRFFVDCFLEKWEKKTQCTISRRKIISIEKKKAGDMVFFQKLAKDLARASQNLSIVFTDNLNIIFKEGWNKISRAPEFNDIEYFKEFIDLVNDFENNINNFNFQDKTNIQVFIGKESPLKEKSFSIIAGKTKAKQTGKNTTLALLGPKRMNFKRNILIMNSLLILLENI